MEKVSYSAREIRDCLVSMGYAADMVRKIATYIDVGLKCVNEITETEDEFRQFVRQIRDIASSTRNVLTDVGTVAEGTYQMTRMMRGIQIEEDDVLYQERGMPIKNYFQRMMGLKNERREESEDQRRMEDESSNQQRDREMYEEDQERDNICQICFEEVTRDEYVCIHERCQKKQHASCINELRGFSSDTKCPNCRRSI